MPVLTAHEKKLLQIFSNEYVFSIPGYQRPYSWGREQAKELIEDLLDSIKDRPENVADMPPYFLGSIVLIKEEGEPAADVVDGQQRLTTLTILLADLRATIASAEGQGITGLIYQKGDLILTTEDHFRLRLRERDRELRNPLILRYCNQSLNCA